MPARPWLVAAGAAMLFCTTPALAAGTTTATPIGGPLLASRGVVVQPLPGAPLLPGAEQLPASSWLVADLSDGQVLAAKDAHGRYLPASTLKMLTAVTLIPQLNPDRMVRITNRDASVDGTRVGLVPKYPYSVRKLFQCLLMFSANDAADALAQAYGGTPATLAAMNAEAQYLQADDTVAKTPSGLDGPGESTSAYDLALIAQAGLAMPAFRHYIATVHTTVPAPHHKHFAIYTHNQLLTTYRGDIGVKNGYTVAAEGTYVGAATRHGVTIVVTLMHANPNFWPMARALLNWGFQADGKVRPVGALVPPRPEAVSKQVVTNPPPSHQSSLTHHARHSWPLELILVVVSVTAAVWTWSRRLRRSRRRARRLRLPPAL